MEIKITSQQMLKFLHVLSWIIFIGLCVDTGSFIFNAGYTFLHPLGSAYFGLSGLYGYDPGYYYVIMLFMSIVGILKTIIFYLIVVILHDKKLNMSQPFNAEMGRLVFKITYLALGTGLFAHWGMEYSRWLRDQGVQMPDTESLHMGGADVWLFMGVVFFVVAHIFKKGIEIQSENELTV